MKNLINVGFIALLTTTLVGCAGYNSVYDVANPSDITVAQALYDVGDGLSGLKSRLAANGNNYGLLLDEVNVDFNVTANASKTGKLSIDLSNPIALTTQPGSVVAKGETGFTDTASRGNVVKIKMKNILTASLNERGKAGFDSRGPIQKVGTMATCPKDMICTFKVESAPTE